MNELSEELSDCRTGCMLGNITVNHYMYAGDLVVFPQVVLVSNSCLIYILIMGLDMMCNTIQKILLPWYVEPKNIEIWISQICIYQGKF